MKAKKVYVINKDYSPSVDEQYMNPKQIEYFKDTLEKWRMQTQHNLNDVEEKLAELSDNDERDEMDRAFLETEISIIINKMSALQNLLNDIDLSMEDIETGKYGYCQKTGIEIGLKRLLAKPTSRFAIKAQEDTENELNNKKNNTKYFVGERKN